MPINYWTPEEDKLLKELYQTEMTVEEIAERLRRTEQAVKKRVSKTGIKRYSTSYHGCTEDCFNCPYPDCMKQGGFSESY